MARSTIALALVLVWVSCGEDNPAAPEPEVDESKIPQEGVVQYSASAIFGRPEYQTWIHGLKGKILQVDGYVVYTKIPNIWGPLCEIWLCAEPPTSQIEYGVSMGKIPIAGFEMVRPENFSQDYLDQIKGRKLTIRGLVYRIGRSAYGAPSLKLKDGVVVKEG